MFYLYAIKLKNFLKIVINFRPIQIEDCKFICEVRNECAIEYLHDSTLFTIENVINWYKNLKVPYYIVFNEKTKIGYFRLSNYSPINKNIYIGMDLHENFRGNGFAFESYCKFIPFILNKYNLNKISLEVLSTNIRAQHLYNKLGFSCEGIKRQEVFKNGKYIDSIIMSLLKEEILQSKLYL